MRRWRPTEIEVAFQHPLMSVQLHTVTSEEEDAAEGADEDLVEERQALVLDMPGWVNIVALTEDRHVLFVRQWRFGLERMTLEVPGGIVEDGEDERVAAERELYEETGYRASRWHRLGQVHPNPAIQNNCIGTWLATDLQRIGEPPGDGDEELEVVTFALADVPAAISSGEISHSLVVTAFYLLAQHEAGTAL